MNNENLISIGSRSKEEQARITRAGAKAAVIARRKNKEEERQKHLIADALYRALTRVDEDGVALADKLIAQRLNDSIAKGSVSDLKVIAEILGELKTSVQAVVTPTISLEVIGGDDEEDKGITDATIVE